MDTGRAPVPVAALAAEIGRLADRLRTTSDVRLRQVLTPEVSRAAAALDVAQQLADSCQGVVGRDAVSSPVRRVVPDLGVFALGDQVAVTGADLLTALAEVAPEAQVWSHDERRVVSEVIAELTETVRALRLVL